MDKFKIKIEQNYTSKQRVIQNIPQIFLEDKVP